MYRTVLICCAALLCMGSCREEASRMPYQEIPLAEAIRFADAGRLAKACSETTSDSLEKTGFFVEAALSDGAVLFTDKTIWDDTLECFKTASEDHMRPVGDGLYMDFDAVCPPFLEIKGGCVNYVLDSGTDVLAASRREVPSGENPVSLTFNHIMARVTLSVGGKEKNVDYTVRSLCIGTAREGTFLFDSGGWSTGKDTTLLLSPSGEDLCLFPGTITVSAAWDTAREGVVTGSYERSVSLKIEKGKHHIIRLLLSDDRSRELEFTSRVNAWEEENKELTLM